MSNLYFGREIRGAESMPSTQDAARTLVERDGASAAGVSFMTPHQTAGRGRQGRTWYAPPGANLTETLIGRPVALADVWQVSFVAAVAVADAITAVVPDIAVHLRFPNDVLLHGKKVCGILIETATGPDVPPDTAMPLIGIGVNVRGGTDALPPEVAVRATTIEAEAGDYVAVGVVGAHLSITLTRRWNEWRAGDGFVSTLAAWHGYHDSDARRTFLVDDVPVLCRVVAVSWEGYATLELPDQTRRTVPVAHVLFANG
ncbi:MAG: biotin--[acetyl-CoA-carboxylase] ligase [Akkermansiaceae bacterium]|nr:biotin--[acetyl-CoA-carboxylase] ligase [Armatimonadota bacterium]